MQQNIAAPHYCTHRCTGCGKK